MAVIWHDCKPVCNSQFHVLSPLCLSQRELGIACLCFQSGVFVLTRKRFLWFDKANMLTSAFAGVEALIADSLQSLGQCCCVELGVKNGLPFAFVSPPTSFTVSCLLNMIWQFEFCGAAAHGEIALVSCWSPWRKKLSRTVVLLILCVVAAQISRAHWISDLGGSFSTFPQWKSMRTVNFIQQSLFVVSFKRYFRSDICVKLQLYLVPWKRSETLSMVCEHSVFHCVPVINF